ncbi:MAG: hypothetical protein D6806_07835 [Deltaproteobacteria bacterium]|nr:MAG: hypothetical protein D6806_07835 [Deltaproteobacteria bacterium]
MTAEDAGQKFQVDLDREAVLYENEWLRAEQLADRIKRMIESQDFRIAAAGMALEHLQKCLKGARSFTVKLLEEDAARLEAYASQAGKTAETFVRQAVLAYLAAQPPLPEQPVQKKADTPDTITTEPVQPGEAEQVVELTNKKASPSGVLAGSGSQEEKNG